MFIKKNELSENEWGYYDYDYSTNLFLKQTLEKEKRIFFSQNSHL